MDRVGGPYINSEVKTHIKRPLYGN
jgi:hypothetical protein